MKEPRIRLFKKPIKRKISVWREMEYDASLKLDGLRWLRALGGFGEGAEGPGDGSREDWVCEIPSLGINVSRISRSYGAGRGWSAGFEYYDSLSEAMRVEISMHRRFVDGEITEARTALDSLSIKRNDKLPPHDWRELQAIKNEVAGWEREAIEIYPAESRLVDDADQTWLWVLPAGEKVGTGFPERRVDSPTAKTTRERTGKGSQRAWRPKLSTGPDYKPGK